MTSRYSPIERQILEEMHKAAERFGAAGDEIRTVPAEEMYDALEALGADRFLLATVGSWRDTLSDAEVLDALRKLNAGDELLDHAYASTSAGRKTK